MSSTEQPAYEPSEAYIFEASQPDGTLRDRFSFYGPFRAGYELAVKRGALYGAPVIGYQREA